MSDLFASGRVVDLILGLMLLEGALLLLYHRRTGRGIAPRLLLATLVSGACLLLALRTALTGAGWLATGAWLTAALLAHLGDLASRWRRQRGSGRLSG